MPFIEISPKNLVLICFHEFLSVAEEFIIFLLTFTNEFRILVVHGGGCKWVPKPVVVVMWMVAHG